MAWIAGDLTTNPAADAVLADTGSLPSGTYSFQVVITAKPAGVEVYLQLATSDGLTVQRSKILRDREPPQLLHFLTIQAGQRIRVLNRLTLSGGAELQVSIFYRAQPVDSMV